MYRKYGRTKPPAGATVDWGHPLANGLMGSWLYNENAGAVLASLVNPKNSAVVTGAWTNGRLIGGWGNAANPDSLVSSFMTVMVLFDPCGTWSNGAGRGSIIERRPVANNAGWAIQNVFAGAVGAVDFYVHASGSFTNNQTTGWATSGVQNLTGTYDGVAIRTYRAGKLIGSTAKAGGITAGAGNLFQLGHEPISPGTYAGCLLTAHLWNRPLVPADVAWLNQEPFAMIRSPRAVQYFVPQAAPSGFNAGRVQRGVVIGGGSL